MTLIHLSQGFFIAQIKFPDQYKSQDEGFQCFLIKKNHPLKRMVCRPTGIRTPDNGTKNRCVTTTLWVCVIFGGANLQFFSLSASNC